MDVNKYIGIPFDSKNCWQLVILVLKEEFNIVVNHMNDMTADDMNAVSSEMDKGRTLCGWRIVDKPKHGDICMMSVNNHGKARPEHVGIVIFGNTVLHSMGKNGINSAAHPIRTLNRKFANLEYFRHATR